MNKIDDRSSILRYNLATILIYIVGIVLLLTLFNLQIIHGEEYREQSNTRLTRESVLRAARGSIKDRTGIELVTNETGFGLEIYRTKVDDVSLNTAIRTMIKILEENGDKYIDHFPIKVKPFRFTHTSEETQKNWKKNNNIEENATAEQAFEYFKKKYKIEIDNVEEARKVIAVRYEITRNGYSATRSVKIASDISRKSAVKLREQNSRLAGMNIITEPTVKYTSGRLASHILGYVGAIDEKEYETRKDTYRNDDIIGKDGIQYIFEKYLKGQDGIRQIDMTVDGSITSEYVSKEAISGSDVILTIDAKLQAVAEKALAKNVQDIANGKYGRKKKDAKAGSVVVMNVKTGEVLALASYPDYEPELFIKGISQATYDSYNEGKNMYNRAVSGSYAPGSTFKMATALAGLETGNITTTSKINDRGVYPRGGNPVCWYYNSYRAGHGYLNVSEAIKHSCNYFFYEVGYRTKIDNIAKYASYLGLGRKTGIELLGETSGILATPEVAKKNGSDWYLGMTLSAAIGQTYNSFSPLQMAKYVSMLSNGGKNIDVTLIKSIITPDGVEVPKKEINNYTNQILGLKNEVTEDLHVDPDNLKAILKGMKGVTSERGGTAYSTFANFKIEVGGKTGSAQTGDGKDAHAWFVGFAPYDEPEIAVVVMVEHGSSGGNTASVAKEIISEYFGMNAQSVTEDMQGVSSVESVR